MMRQGYFAEEIDIIFMDDFTSCFENCHSTIVNNDKYCIDVSFVLSRVLSTGHWVLHAYV